MFFDTCVHPCSRVTKALAHVVFPYVEILPELGRFTEFSTSVQAPLIFQKSGKTLTGRISEPRPDKVEDLMHNDQT
jgi:hypothetical protein